MTTVNVHALQTLRRTVNSPPGRLGISPDASAESKRGCGRRTTWDVGQTVHKYKKNKYSKVW